MSVVAGDAEYLEAAEEDDCDGEDESQDGVDDAEREGGGSRATVGRAAPQARAVRQRGLSNREGRQESCCGHPAARHAYYHLEN